MDKTKRTIRRLLLMAPALLLLAAATLADAAVRPGLRPGGDLMFMSVKGGCSETAKSVDKSCKQEALSDYWLAIGKCQNLRTGGERLMCSEDAMMELAEGREECKDQYEARLEICEALGEDPYQPVIDPNNFVGGIDNPFLPYVPGSTWTYEGETEDGTETIVVEVTHGTREVMGVTCTVVRDTAYLDGEAIEDTLDYYAQDIWGNVWYFGELSYEIEDGVIVSLEGSWEAGVDGAVPGVVMPDDLMTGDVYRQEFLLGEAEDMGKILSLNASASVPYGDFTGCRQTADFTPIEPDVLEEKFYAAGVGLVLEVNPGDDTRVELISFTP